MSTKRFIKKSFIPFYNAKDLIEKVQDYGIVDGIKEKLREDFIEDMPIISNIYNLGKADGRYEGKYNGYNQASDEYEEKFNKQIKDFKSEREEYINNSEDKSRLLDGYEEYIENLNSKFDIILDDNDKLILYLFEKQFLKLIDEYQLTVEESKIVMSHLGEKLSNSDIENMVLISNKTKYAYDMIDDIIKLLFKDKDRNGTLFDEYGYSKFGYDKNGKRINVSKYYYEDANGKVTYHESIKNENYNCNNQEEIDLSKYDERGFKKHTIMHKNGTKYDDYGYSKYGYDKDGNRINIKEHYYEDANGQITYHDSNKKEDDNCSNQEEVESSIYDERGFERNSVKHRNGTLFDEYGYSKFGYDKNGKRIDISKHYHEDANGKVTYHESIKNESDNYNNQEELDLSKYDERGFKKHTVMHKNGTKYDNYGYSKYGYDKNGNRINIKEHYYEDANGQITYHDSNKKKDDNCSNQEEVESSIYDERGFEWNSVKHRNGTLFDEYGYSKFGYDKNRKRINISKHYYEDANGKVIYHE